MKQKNENTCYKTVDDKDETVNHVKNDIRIFCKPNYRKENAQTHKIKNHR